MNVIVGKKIKRIKKLPKVILDVNMWEARHPGWAIELDDGTLIYASCDEEGNGPGSMFVTTAKGEDYYMGSFEKEK